MPSQNGPVGQAMRPPLSPFMAEMIDLWRKELERVACGPVEGVWDGLSVVISGMRLVLGTDEPQPVMPARNEATR